MYKKLSITTMSIILALSIIGCGNDNSSMYMVEKVPEVVEKPMQIGVGEVQAGISDGADTDKNLGKKQLLIVNGQPIAALVSDYTNENGYTTIVSKPDSTETGAVDNSNLPITGLGLLELIKTKDSLQINEIQKICERYNLDVTTVDMDAMEELAETEVSLAIVNDYYVKELLVASSDNITVTYMIFEDIDDNILEELDINNREIITIGINTGEYSDILGDNVDTDYKELYYLDIDNKYIIASAYADTHENEVKDILNEMGIK